MGQRRRANILSPHFHGSLTRWLKQEGDSVQRNEPLCELGRDRVRVEFPSPIGGTLLNIRSAVGSTIWVNSVIAVIEVPTLTLDREDEVLQVLGYKVPPDFTWVEAEIEKLKREKEEAISVLNLERAAELTDKVRLLTRQKLRWTETDDGKGYKGNVLL